MANFNVPSWRNPFSNFSVINPAKKFKGENKTSLIKTNQNNSTFG
jgi:hypothetical protein